MRFTQLAQVIPTTGTLSSAGEMVVVGVLIDALTGYYRGVSGPPRPKGRRWLARRAGHRFRERARPPLLDPESCLASFHCFRIPNRIWARAVLPRVGQS